MHSTVTDKIKTHLAFVESRILNVKIVVVSQKIYSKQMPFYANAVKRATESIGLNNFLQYSIALICSLPWIK